MDNQDEKSEKSVVMIVDDTLANGKPWMPTKNSDHFQTWEEKNGKRQT